MPNRKSSKGDEAQLTIEEVGAKKEGKGSMDEVEGGEENWNGQCDGEEHQVTTTEETEQTTKGGFGEEAATAKQEQEHWQGLDLGLAGGRRVVFFCTSTGFQKLGVVH